MSLGSAARWVATQWREGGVQVRSTVAATLVQGLVVLAAGGALLLSLVNSLHASVDAATLSTAQSIAALVPADLTGSADLRSAVDAASRRREAVQVLDENGAVVVASPELRGYRAVVGDRPAPGVTEHRKVHLPFDDDPYRVTVLGGTVADDGLDRRFTVVVAQSVGTGEDTLHAAVVAMAVAGPLLLLTVGFATYVFVGRSLRPVTRIRSTVEGISHRDLSERVPIPPGRDEVARLATTMNSMLTGLERADAAQRQFVSDASHELRSPIATLRAAADIALAQPGRTDPRDLARLVRGEARRLDGLVADLLLLARVDERGRGRTTPGAGAGGEVEEVDLDDLVTDEHRRLRAATTLTVTMHREPARVLGDPRELSRVLRNLTDNAARHAHRAVSIELRRNGSNAALTVWNDGAPIPAADRERVFDRFVRLEESRTRDSGGSGLGLAIVRDVVAAHGGSVRVLDVGTGTSFRVELPLAAEFGVSPGG